MSFETKAIESFQADVEIKDVNDDTNTVTGIASTPDVDQSNDQFTKGAWTKSLKEKVPQGLVKFLDSHGGGIGVSSSDVAGTVVEAEGRQGNLWFQAELSDAPDVQSLKTKIKEGHLDKLSVGFRPHETEEENGIRKIKQAELVEISVVPFPDNRNTEITNYKSMQNDFIKMTPKQRAQAVKTLTEMGIESKELDEARNPAYKEAATGVTWDAPTMEECWKGFFDNTDNDPEDFDNFDTDSNWDEAPQPARKFAADLTFLGEASADTFDEAMSFPVTDPESMKMPLDALKSAYSLRGQGTSNSQKESIASMVEKIVTSEESFEGTDFRAQFEDEEEASEDTQDVDGKQEDNDDEDEESETKNRSVEDELERLKLLELELDN